MPKLKNIEEQQNTNLRALIAYKKELYGFKTEQLAQRIGVSHATLNNKLRKPKTFTLNDIRKMKTVLSLSDEEILSIL